MSQQTPAAFAKPRFGERVRTQVDRIGRTQPGRLAVGIFLLFIAAETLALSLPFATASGHRAPFVDALFTATSAVCVTGLTTVDTGTYWSLFGQIIIAVGIKVGGLGVVTIAALLGLAVSRRLGLTGRLLAQQATQASVLGEVGSLLRFVIAVSTSLEVILALVLLPRFLTHGESTGTAVWHSVFYAVSAFNSAGFTAHPNGMPAYANNDWWLSLPLAIGVFLGGVGFPVMVTIGRQWREPSRWNLHTKLTLTSTGIVFAVSVVIFAVFEWANPDTLGPMGWSQKLLNIIFLAVMPRSGGLSIIPTSDLYEHTWLATDLLMFIGGGSASTAGGIKVTTVAVLFLATVAEARGDADSEAFGRRIPASTLRLAVTVLAAGAAACTMATMALVALTDVQLDRALFEVISAFGTCGLSLGITSDLPPVGKVILILMMFFGRTGTMSLTAMLALRERPKMFRLAEERPIVG